MRVVSTCLVLLWAWACNPAKDLQYVVATDLVADFDLAQVQVEPRLIDIGTSEARVFLGDGWSWNERGRDGKDFVWGTFRASDLWFYLQRQRPLTLNFRCLPFRREEGSVEALGVVLNGVRIADVALRRGWREYSVSVPAEPQRMGANHLQLEYRWSLPDLDDLPKTGNRRVAVAWDWIELTSTAGVRPTARREGGLLYLTAGSQVDYYLELPSASMLAIETVEFPSDAPSRLEISVLMDGKPDETTWVLEPDSGSRPVRQRLSAASELIRLRFRSTGSSVLSQPRVLVDPAGRSAAATAPMTSTRPTKTIPRNDPSLILIYLIDTLRADHLGQDGYDRDTTPVIDQWLRDAVVFDGALAASSWTKPSVASLFTGRQPWTHGAEGDRDAIAEDLPVVAEILRQLGYRTAGFSANGYVSGDFGFDRGFDHFALMPDFDSPAERVSETALEWLATQATDAPVFLYIQTIDPHTPYAPNDPQRGRFVAGNPGPEVGSIPFMRELAQSRRAPDSTLLRDLVDLYDAEIAYSDEQFGRLLEALRRLGRYDDALVILLSDHGEEFFDHGSWTHSRTLYREVVRVPFAIRFPHDWGAGTRVTDDVQLIDVVPTLLDYLERPIPPALPGRSLLGLLARADDSETEPGPRPPSRPLFAGVHHNNNHWVSVVQGNWKLVLRGPDRLDNEAQLFDLDRDPWERENVADEHPVRVGLLATSIRRELALTTRRNRPRSIELEDETAERLRALGYFN